MQPMYRPAFIPFCSSSSPGVTCAHRCDAEPLPEPRRRCGCARHRFPSPDNVRCPHCGHTFLELGDLPTCGQCRCYIYDCDSCVRSVGGFRPCSRFRSGYTAYCTSCWVEWHTEQHLQECAAIPVTLRVVTSPDAEGAPAETFEISCETLAGKQVAAQRGTAAAAVTVGEVRARVKQALGIQEARLARDGKFYDKAAFLEWYSDGERACEMWDRAPGAASARLVLALPTGQVLNESSDAVLVSSLLGSAEGEVEADPAGNDGLKVGHYAGAQRAFSVSMELPISYAAHDERRRRVRGPVPEPQGAQAGCAGPP